MTLSDVTELFPQNLSQPCRPTWRAAESEAARRRVKMGSHATDGGPPVLVDAQRQTHYQLRSPGWKMTQIGG